MTFRSSKTQKKKKDMKTIKNLILGALSISVILVASVSCEREDIRTGSTTGAITLKVTSESDLATKAMDQTPETYLADDLSTEDSPLFLTLSTEKNCSDVLGGARTKGTVITNDNLGTAGNRETFKVNIYNGTSEYANVAGNTNHVVGQNGAKNWGFQTEVDWPGNTALDFYSHSDATNASASYSVTGKGAFSYTGVVGGNKAQQDGAKTSDFIVAHSNTNENDVHIHFYHALAAVRFYCDSVTITKVAIRNVKYKGTFNYVEPTLKDGKATDVDGIFNWSADNDKTTYTQTYETAPDFSKLKNGVPATETFFIVPQAVNNNDVIITFYFKESATGKEMNISTKALGTSKWKAGYVYNYTLTKSKSKVEPSVTLVVNDEMNEDRTEKADVVVENLKSNAAYVRAHVIANWYNTAHKAVAPWDQLNDGGTLTINNTGVWVKGDDGFYYCLQPVIGYSQTTNFIDKASIKDATAPASVYDLRLEMKIIAQGVEYDDKQEAFKATWPGAGSAVINNLKKL